MIELGGAFLTGMLAMRQKRLVQNAQIDFVPNPARSMLHGRSQTISDSYAREEWGWQPTHDLDRIINDCLAALA
jgi:nucleoside-diphosphate-sugar epimerase